MKVLLVDDNELLLEVAEASLSEAGFEVVTSNSALGFTAALGTLRPDVALIDVMMPALNGNHLVEIARRGQCRNTSKQSSSASRMGSSCLFYLHSNLPEADLRQLAESCGAEGFIRKSSRPGSLGGQLRILLADRGIAPAGGGVPQRRGKP